MSAPQMRITIRYWAILADLVGCQTELLEVPLDATVEHAMDTLIQHHEAISSMRPMVATAIDDQYVRPDHVLHAGDELSLIPPVSGG